MLRTLFVAVLFSTAQGGNLTSLQESLADLLRVRVRSPMPEPAMRRVLRDLDPLADALAGVRDGPLLCHSCRFLVANVQKGALPVSSVGRVLCRIYVALTTGTVSTFCDDIIDAHIPIFGFIVENSAILDPEYACSVLLQNKGCYYDKPALKWTVEVPSDAQKKVPEVPPGPPKRPLKILHITDVHLQPDYAPGTLSDCGLPLCCRKDVQNVRPGRAGTWGDYLCDVPIATYRDALRRARDAHGDLDLIYFTGDMVDHTSWRESRGFNADVLTYGFEALGEFFPGTPVLPVVGNHESAPLNVFAPSDPAVEAAGLSTAWLYELLARLWGRWLPRESLETVRRQGYYAVEIDARFKVIALNNNVCYNFNWWLLYDTAFLREQLEFLRDELAESESRGQFVHVIAHVPVGNGECVEPWERSYAALIERYSHLVKGQFFGHTHTDGLKVFRSAEGGAPLGVAFNGASLTPYQDYNPDYKVMRVDGGAYDVIDVDTYVFNLTEANAGNGAPRWYKLYSMREAYGLEDLGAESIDALAGRFLEDDGLFDTYWRYYVREGDPSLRKGCDAKCRKKMICEIFTTESIKADC